MELDPKTIAEMGGKPGTPARLDSVMRYVHGCITRERQRVAAILERHNLADAAKVILDDGQDREVFRWAAAASGLNAPLRSAADKVKTRMKRVANERRKKPKGKGKK